MPGSLRTPSHRDGFGEALATTTKSGLFFSRIGVYTQRRFAVGHKLIERLVFTGILLCFVAPYGSVFTTTYLVRRGPYGHVCLYCVTGTVSVRIQKLERMRGTK